MVFDKHTAYRQLVLNPLKEKQNIFNTPLNVLEPKDNEILMFPSELTHQVEPNMSKERRYSIAFNAFVKGTLGDFRDVSQLTL